MTTLSVVIPAYNEEDGIAEIAHRVLAVRDSLREVGVDGLELLVVDDGSKDKTVEIARSIDGVTLIKHPQNKGYGGALKTGFSQAKGELIGFLDADGTYPPEYFPKLCVEAMNGSEIVVGSRMAGADSQMPLTRRVGNFFFANLLSLLGRQRITDSASGMRVFKKEVLQKIYPLPDGLNLTPVMSTRALHEQIKMTEIPIPYSERLGRSKLSVVHDGRLFLESMVWTAMTYNPVRILGLVGLAGIIIAALVVIGLVVARIGDTTSLGAWGVTAVFTALITSVGGISIFALGVTFNYMVSIFHKQPIRQGLFRKPIFKTPINHHFGWLGILAVVLGLILGIGSLSLAINQNWPIQRVWLYLLGSAMSTLVGLQLIIYWVLLRVLEELSQREILAKRDLKGYG
ncbi:MAG: glycosyltransferase family 2 protein [Ardenticatenaceae bacterium]|nr:glycosyltransferase family 2 protein [Ardenticatenaceae bacterium]